MNNQYLKRLACLCKTSVFWILIAYARWNVSAIADAWVVGMAVLSSVPNRWLVSSRISFVIVRLPSLVPLRVFFDTSSYRNLD
jgi:hypothetical protein